MYTFIAFPRKYSCKNREKPSTRCKTRGEIEKKVVHNFSSYNLTGEEIEILSFGIDHYIPLKAELKRIEVEFEYYYKNILSDITDLQEAEKMGLKTHLLSACRQYTEIKVPYKHPRVIKSLTENESICLLKQDKGRGVIVIDRTDYVEKCDEMLKSKQFIQLQNDPTAKFERKVQNKLLELKKNKHFTEEEYRSFYHSGSRPGPGLCHSQKTQGTRG